MVSGPRARRVSVCGAQAIPDSNRWPAGLIAPDLLRRLTLETVRSVRSRATLPNAPVRLIGRGACTPRSLHDGFDLSPVASLRPEARIDQARRPARVGVWFAVELRLPAVSKRRAYEGVKSRRRQRVISSATLRGLSQKYRSRAMDVRSKSERTEPRFPRVVFEGRAASVRPRARRGPAGDPVGD